MLKKLKLNYALIGLLSMTLIINSCEKDDENTPSSPYNGKTTAVFNPDLTYGTMTDQDGNVYKTITIGTQTWMAENLRVTKYRNGDPIPNVTDNTTWSTLTTGAYCTYENTADAVTIATNGMLYNWYAATDSRNIAPEGWHVPTDAEWTTLINHLGGEDIAGGKMKEIGTTHWESPNTGATNEIGFTSLPSGDRANQDGTPSGMGSFDGLGYGSFYWSSTADDANYAYFRMQFYYAAAGYFDNEATSKWFGYSLRLIKD